MVYEVMQLRKNRKLKKTLVKKFQFDSKEKAESFCKASKHPTELYKLDKIA